MFAPELYHPLLTVGLPLWLDTATDAPALLVSGLLVLDTVLVLLFRVAVSKSGRRKPGRSGPCPDLPGRRASKPAAPGAKAA
ncbi:hypothetical protein ACF09Y_23695 [Streptomyces massasporeus]|uniref:hypothetical protein n=1 Tax=Streptomyces massasporeus TaxID=67324 RepID=UPI0036FAAAD1